MTDETADEKSEVEQSISTAEATASGNEDLVTPNPPPAWVSYLVLVALGIYALFLSSLALDETFDFGWYPTVLEKQVRGEIARLTDTNTDVQKEAHDNLLDGEMFVVVPELIRNLSNPSPEMRRATHKLLLEVTPPHINAPVLGYSPDGSPEDRKRRIKDLWKWWGQVENNFY